MLQGYCTSSKSCKTFAVVLATFGSALMSAVDEAALDDLAAYMQPLCGLPACLAADGAHGPISSWMWNGWTPKSYGEVINIVLSPCMAPLCSLTAPAIPVMQGIMQAIIITTITTRLSKPQLA